MKVWIYHKESFVFSYAMQKVFKRNYKLRFHPHPPTPPPFRPPRPDDLNDVFSIIIFKDRRHYLKNHGELRRN